MRVVRVAVFGASVLVSLIGVSASTASAGGWAVTTLDTLPRQFNAGETYRIGYTVRQHGETPLRGGTTAIELQRPGEAT